MWLVFIFVVFFINFLILFFLFVIFFLKILMLVFNFLMCLMVVFFLVWRVFNLFEFLLIFEVFFLFFLFVSNLFKVCKVDFMYFCWRDCFCWILLKFLVIFFRIFLFFVLVRIVIILLGVVKVFLKDIVVKILKILENLFVYCIFEKWWLDNKFVFNFYFFGGVVFRFFLLFNMVDNIVVFYDGVKFL